MEFQLVGARIPEDQLVEVRSTLQAIASANGTTMLEAWMQNIRQFDREQLVFAAGLFAWRGPRLRAMPDANTAAHFERQASDVQRDVEMRDQQWAQRLQTSDQNAAELERQLEQARNEREHDTRALREAQAALEERSRQVSRFLQRRARDI